MATGIPTSMQYSVAYMSMNVTATIDLEPTFCSLAMLSRLKKTGTGKPMTYADYRVLKSGGTLEKGTEQSHKKRWVCSVCHYVYDGEIPLRICRIPGCARSANSRSLFLFWRIKECKTPAGTAKADPAGVLHIISVFFGFFLAVHDPERGFCQSEQLFLAGVDGDVRDETDALLN